MGIESKPRLSQGPPDVSTQVRFSKREMEFIELRYGQVLTRKELSSIMGISERTAKYYSINVFLKLNLDTNNVNKTACIITVTKFLIKNGFIKL